MNIFRSLGSAIRRLSILLLIVALVSFFLFLYYYRYIPTNRERLQRQGFLLLKQQDEGLRQSIDDFGNYFTSETKKLITVNFGIDLDSTDERFKEAIPYRRKGSKLKPDSDFNLPTDTTPLVHFHYDDKELAYQFRVGQAKLEYMLDLDSVFANILEPRKREFFSDYFVVNFQDSLSARERRLEGGGGIRKLTISNLPHTLYHTSAFPLVEQWITDTLVGFNSIQFPKIEDLEIGGVRYKAFLQPFQFKEARQLVLVGLIPLTDYNDRLQNIPFRPVSIILILFLLVLIGLPYIKTFFISPEEKFGIRDIIGLGFTMFVGSAILLVIFQHMMMRTGASLRSKEDLRLLSDSINFNLKQELGRVNDALVYWDNTLLHQRIEQARSFGHGGDSASLLLVRQRERSDTYFRLPFPRDSFPYVNYNIVHWADGSGRQIVKGNLFSGAITFNNLLNRTYFTDILKNKMYLSHSNSGKPFSFCIQPVISMSTHAFEANISERSIIPDYKMVAVSAQLYSIINSILPPAYGFYIVDQSGRIQYQSEGAVTLKENFLDWINDQHDLEMSMLSRQNRSYNDLTFNNKRYSVFMRPLDDLPLYLIVYRNNDESTSSILHVTAFTMCMTLLYFLLISLYCWIAWTNTHFYSLLYQPIFQYSWLKPGNDKMKFFKSGIGFIAVYLIFTVIFLLALELHSATLFIGFIFPLFTLWTLYILFRKLYLLQPRDYTTRESVENVRATLFQLYNLTPFIILFGLIVAFFKLEDRLMPRLWLMIYIAVSFFLIWLVSYRIPRMKNQLFVNLKLLLGTMDLQAVYYVFWFACMVSISFIPVHCFFQYAQAKEINASIRKTQLGLAQSMESRLASRGWFVGVLERRNIQESQKDSVLFLHGIYSMRMCSGISIKDSIARVETNEEPYDRMLRMVSWDYHSLDRMMIAQSRAEDQQWNWQYVETSTGDSAALNYRLRNENITNSIFARGGFHLVSPIPRILAYLRLNTFVGRTSLFFLSASLIIGFLIVFRNITQRLFLLRYQPIRGEIGDAEDLLFFKLYDSIYDRFEAAVKKALDINDETVDATTAYTAMEEKWAAEYHCDDKSESSLATLEGQILKNQYAFKEIYDQFWDDCDEKEKYVLFNLSREGFVNYRNTLLIRGLMRKGLVIFDENNGLNIMSVSFRNYIIDKKNDEEITQLADKFHKRGSWDNIRTPILIAITAFGTFLFITQEDLLQRAAALVPTLSGLFGLGSLILGSKSSSSSPR